MGICISFAKDWPLIWKEWDDCDTWWLMMTVILRFWNWNYNYVIVIIILQILPNLHKYMQILYSRLAYYTHIFENSIYKNCGSRQYDELTSYSETVYLSYWKPLVILEASILINWENSLHYVPYGFQIKRIR